MITTHSILSVQFWSHFLGTLFWQRVSSFICITMLNATISQMFEKYLLKEQISKWWDEWISLLRSWQIKDSCIIVQHKVNLQIKSNIVFLVLSHSRISVCWEMVPSVPVHTPKKDKWKECFLFCHCPISDHKSCHRDLLTLWISFFSPSDRMAIFEISSIFFFCYRHNEWLKVSALKITKPLSKNIGDLKVDLLW